jgi:hypothetical protein
MRELLDKNIDNATIAEQAIQNSENDDVKMCL